MKKIATLTIGAIALLLASCGDGSGDKATTPTDTITATNNTTTTKVKDSAPAGVLPVDPVCNMDYEAKWTLNSEYNGTKVFFCSEHCKETFDKNPAKYVTAEGTLDPHAGHNH